MKRRGKTMLIKQNGKYYHVVKEKESPRYITKGRKKYRIISAVKKKKHEPYHANAYERFRAGTPSFDPINGGNFKL